jgi:hypothetical protein
LRKFEDGADEIEVLELLTESVVLELLVYNALSSPLYILQKLGSSIVSPKSILKHGERTSTALTANIID